MMKIEVSLFILIYLLMNRVLNFSSRINTI